MERAQNADPITMQRAMKAMSGLTTFLDRSGLERSLLELIEIRASQINGCAYCLDMHTKDARAGGESEQRIYLLEAWRETSLYTERERAALAWTEAVTLVADGHVPDAVYEEVRHVFTDDEVVALTVAAATINAWTRINVGLRTIPGTYQPAAAPIGAAVGTHA